MPACYVCGSPVGEYRQCLNGPYQIVKCGMCGLEFTDPIPTKETLTHFYTDYSDMRAAWQIVEKTPKTI